MLHELLVVLWVPLVALLFFGRTFLSVLPRWQKVCSLPIPMVMADIVCWWLSDVYRLASRRGGHKFSTTFKECLVFHIDIKWEIFPFFKGICTRLPVSSNLSWDCILDVDGDYLEIPFLEEINWVVDNLRHVPMPTAINLNGCNVDFFRKGWNMFKI